VAKVELLTLVAVAGEVVPTVHSDRILRPA
jgi:hypothetical protein